MIRIVGYEGESLLTQREIRELLFLVNFALVNILFYCELFNRV